MSDYEVPNDWQEWMPASRDGEMSMLRFLRYVVIEVVAPSATTRVVKWMDRIVGDIISHLCQTKHPIDPSESSTNCNKWKEWIATSVIAYIHNACVLEGIEKQQQAPPFFPPLFLRLTLPSSAHPSL